MTTEAVRAGGLPRALPTIEVGAEQPIDRRSGSSIVPRALELVLEGVRHDRDAADLGLLPRPSFDAGGLAALGAIVGGGDLLEHVAAMLCRGRRTETGAGEATQRARAADVDAQLDAQRRAMERAQEAADDAGFWDTFGEVAAWVGAAVAVVAAIPTGGATLALAGVAAAAAIGSQYAGDIAEVMCDAGIIDRSALDDWTLGLSVGCAAVALAAGIGGAFAGAGAAASQLSAVERGVRTSSQVAQTAAGLAQGVSTGGGAVCRSDEADARVDAERSEHRADVAQQERDETIELIHGTAQAWCREMRRMTEMVRAAHDTASQALAANRA